MSSDATPPASDEIEPVPAPDPRAHVPESDLTPDELLDVCGPSWADVRATSCVAVPRPTDAAAA